MSVCKALQVYNEDGRVGRVWHALREAGDITESHCNSQRGIYVLGDKGRALLGNYIHESLDSR